LRPVYDEKTRGEGPSLLRKGINRNRVLFLTQKRGVTLENSLMAKGLVVEVKESGKGGGARPGEFNWCRDYD